MQTCWTVGYVIGQIPSNLILTRIRPSIWIPSMEVNLTFVNADEKKTGRLTLSKLYRSFGPYSHFASADVVPPNRSMLFDSSLVRLFNIFFGTLGPCVSIPRTDVALSGLAESSFYPGMQYVIGSWYRKDELAKRSCIFHVSSAIATMVSGYLMAAVYHLGGNAGFSGWQWYVPSADSAHPFTDSSMKVVHRRWSHLSSHCLGRLHLHPGSAWYLPRNISKCRGNSNLS